MDRRCGLCNIEGLELKGVTNKTHLEAVAFLKGHFLAGASEKYVSRTSLANSDLSAY